MKILHFPQVKSTMDEARRAIEGGHIPPFLLLADRQTEGRGRLEGRLPGHDPLSRSFDKLIAGYP